MQLFMQYFRNGFVVVAKKRKCLEKRMKVVIFQLMKKIPTAIPTMPAANAFTFPRYSGARNKESAPKDFMKCPLTVLKRIYQKISNT